METILTCLGGVMFSLYLASLIGGPMILADWLRHRRQQEIGRQIALTDVIDGQLGAIVSPVVKKRLWGPWQVRIQVPYIQPMLVGKILALVGETLSAADQMHPQEYKIVLTLRGEPIPENSTSRPGWSTGRWSHEAVTS